VKLASHTQGGGQDIVLLHGWGLPATVWVETAQALAQNFRVTLIDLPGYGQSPLPGGAYTLEALADRVLAAAPPQAIWIGWSLGGMVAMQAALRQPQRIAGLVLVASTPRFVQGSDWRHAIDVSVLDIFAHALKDNYRTTIARFLALQVRGSEHAQDTLRKLSARLFEHSAPLPEALHGGLAILHNSDLREQLAHISCPTLVIAGTHDTLVPLAAAESLVVMLKTAWLQIIRGAGHAPFLSHPQEFLQAVNEFINEQSATDSYSGAAPAR